LEFSKWNVPRGFPRKVLECSKEGSWNGIPRFSKMDLGKFQDFGMLEKHLSKTTFLELRLEA
jgi:hypothetical protein